MSLIDLYTTSLLRVTYKRAQHPMHPGPQPKVRYVLYPSIIIAPLSLSLSHLIPLSIHP